MMTLPLDYQRHTERLLLCALSTDESDIVVELAKTPGFTDGMSWEPPVDAAETNKFVEQSLAQWKAGKSYNFSIWNHDKTDFIGRIGIRRNEQADSWDIGYFLWPDYWGNGYMIEAARSIMQLGFEELGATIITCGHATWNEPSKKVIQKLGMKHVGSWPAAFLKKGQPVPEEHYELTKEMWLKSLGTGQ